MKPSVRSLVVLLFLGASLAHAQTWVAGQVVHGIKRETVAGVSVELLGRRDSVLATVTSLPDGTFMLPAPGAGSYRVRLTAPGSGSHVSDTLVVADGEYSVHEFAIDPRPRAYSEVEVERSAVAAPGSSSPPYPIALRGQGVGGCVLAQFVVEMDGRVDPATLVVLKASRVEFVDAVRAILLNQRFIPAQLGSQNVRQIVQQSFVFKVESAKPAVVYGNSITPVDGPQGPPTHVHYFEAPPSTSRPSATCTSSQR